MTQQWVALLRELVTAVGTFSPGCEFLAERSGQNWRLHLLPTHDDGPAHTVTVAATDVYPTRPRPKVYDAATARRQLDFARSGLGLTNTAALAWVAEQNKLTTGQLARWGLA